MEAVSFLFPRTAIVFSLVLIIPLYLSRHAHEAVTSSE